MKFTLPIIFVLSAIYMVKGDFSSPNKSAQIEFKCKDSAQVFNCQVSIIDLPALDTGFFDNVFNNTSPNYKRTFLYGNCVVATELFRAMPDCHVSECANFDCKTISPENIKVSK